jgi:hypothetical protein
MSVTHKGTLACPTCGRSLPGSASVCDFILPQGGYCGAPVVKRRVRFDSDKRKSRTMCYAHDAQRRKRERRVRAKEKHD